MFEESIKGKKFACDSYTEKEIFMGFHCGNTASSKICNCQMCFQRIMARALPKQDLQLSDVLPAHYGSRSAC